MRSRANVQIRMPPYKMRAEIGARCARNINHYGYSVIITSKVETRGSMIARARYLLARLRRARAIRQISTP